MLISRVIQFNILNAKSSNHRQFKSTFYLINNDRVKYKNILHPKKIIRLSQIVWGYNFPRKNRSWCHEHIRGSHVANEQSRALVDKINGKASTRYDPPQDYIYMQFIRYRMHLVKCSSCVCVLSGVLRYRLHIIVSNTRQHTAYTYYYYYYCCCRHECIYGGLVCVKMDLCEKKTYL